MRLVVYYLFSPCLCAYIYINIYIYVILCVITCKEGEGEGVVPFSRSVCIVLRIILDRKGGFGGGWESGCCDVQGFP